MIWSWRVQTIKGFYSLNEWNWNRQEKCIDNTFRGNPYEEIKVQAERFDVTYPHGKKYDCEAVFIDQGDAAKAQNTSGRVYFITKGDNQNMNPEWRGGDLFYVDLPQKSSAVDIQETHIRLDIVLATGADMTPSGSLIAVRTYGEIRIYPRAHSVERSLAKQPCGVASENERQGEAVAFGKDGESYITVSEGLPKTDAKRWIGGNGEDLG